MTRVSGGSFARRFTSLLVVTLAFVIWSPGQESQTDSKANGAVGLEKCLLRPSCTERRKAALDLATLDRFQFLLNRYNDADEALREFIVEGIYGSTHGRANEAVIKFMSGIAFHTDAKGQFSDTTWFALQFLAERCDERALDTLNKGRGAPEQSYRYEVQCVDWASTLKAFGKCRYFKARKTLLNSLNSSCLDVLNSAGDSLGVLYPGQCTNVKAFSQATSCYTKLWADEKEQ
jgi:hypothetical protein